MTKKQVMTSIDSDIHKKAKEAQLNISALTEWAIRDKLNKTQVDIPDADKCEFCGKEEAKASRDNLRGLTWLYPNERWICDLCLRTRINQIPVGQK